MSGLRDGSAKFVLRWWAQESFGRNHVGVREMDSVETGGVGRSRYDRAAKTAAEFGTTAIGSIEELPRRAERSAWRFPRFLTRKVAAGCWTWV